MNDDRTLTSKSGGARTLVSQRSSLLDDPRASISSNLGKNVAQGITDTDINRSAPRGGRF